MLLMRVRLVLFREVRDKIGQPAIIQKERVICRDLSLEFTPVETQSISFVGHRLQLCPICTQRACTAFTIIAIRAPVRIVAACLMSTGQASTTPDSNHALTRHRQQIRIETLRGSHTGVRG